MDKLPNKDKRFNLICLYLSAIFFWVIMIVVLGFVSKSIFNILIMMIPVILFTYAIWTIWNGDITLERNPFSFNYLAVIFLIVIPLITLLDKTLKESPGEHKKFMTIVILAMVFTLFSLYDVHAEDKTLYFFNHLRSIFHTYSLTFMILALFMYFSTLKQS